MWFRGSFECCSSSSAQTVSFLVPALLAKISHLNNVSIRNVKRNKKANWPIYSSDTTMKPNFLLLKLINSQQLQDVKANGKPRLAIVSIQIFWYTGTFQSTISKQSVVCCPPFWICKFSFKPGPKFAKSVGSKEIHFSRGCGFKKEAVSLFGFTGFVRTEGRFI